MIRPSVRAIGNYLTIAVFLGILGLPLAGTWLDGRFNQTNDLRPLATFPEIRLKRAKLEAFPSRFEQYWNDHFGFRGLLIRGLSIARLRWLHAPTWGHVLIGRASWLFFALQPPGQDYDTIRPFTGDELERWRRVLEHRRDWLQRRGCRYLLFVPPDKQTIYPEHLDARYRVRQRRSRLDQLLDYLSGHQANVEILDIRQPLLAAKQREQLYHRTDSHWNDRGAFIGYQCLTAALAQWFPILEPKPRSDFVEVEEPLPNGDLARMLPINDGDGEQWLQLVPRLPKRARLAAEGVVAPARSGPLMAQPLATEIDDPRLPRAVMFHDSFVCALQPFLSEHFRRIAYVWHDDFHADVVERERPQIVIQELVERKLGELVPNDIEEEAATAPPRRMGEP